MGEVEWSASSSETNPMLGIGRQSKRQSIGIMWGLSCPTLAGGSWGPWWRWWQHLDWQRCTLMQVDSMLPPSQQTLHILWWGVWRKGWRWCIRSKEGGRTGILLCWFSSYNSSHPTTQPSLPPWGPRSLRPLGEVVHWRCQSPSLCQLGKHSSRWQNKHLANRSRDDTASDTVSSMTPNTSAGLHSLLHYMREGAEGCTDIYAKPIVLH